MKKMTLIPITILLVSLLFTTCSDSRNISKEFEVQLNELPPNTSVCLDTVINLKFDSVYIPRPYQSFEEINEIKNISIPQELQSILEANKLYDRFNIFIFIKNNEIVSYARTSRHTDFASIAPNIFSSNQIFHLNNQKRVNTDSTQ